MKSTEKQFCPPRYIFVSPKNAAVVPFKSAQKDLPYGFIRSLTPPYLFFLPSFKNLLIPSFVFQPLPNEMLRKIKLHKNIPHTHSEKAHIKVPHKNILGLYSLCGSNITVGNLINRYYGKTQKHHETVSTMFNRNVFADSLWGIFFFHGSCFN